jgi:hypothetical protein
VDTHLLWQVQPIGGSGKLGPFDLDVIAALPRPVLLGVVGVVLIGAVFFATRKPGGSTSSPSTPAPASAPSTENPGATNATSSNPPAKGGTAQKPAGKTSVRGLPVPVRKALDAKKVVVILFWNRRAVDDRSVKRSVDRLSRHHGKVAVFTDRVRHLSRYTGITAATSVSQTPALVFVNRKGQAELQTGYLDYQTIQQYLLNALRR